MMSQLEQQQWQDLNDRYVTAAVAWVRALLVEQIPTPQPPKPRPRARKRGLFSWLFRSHEVDDVTETTSNPRPLVESSITVADATAKMTTVQNDLEAAGASSSLAQLADRFGLSAFEQNLLLLCLAFELDSNVGWICGTIQDRPQRLYPTFGLAMSLFHGPEWIAITPGRPLRKFRLVEFRHPTGTPLFGAELRLEETILHYLRGVPSLDSRLASFVSPVNSCENGLTESQQAIVDRVSLSFSSADETQVVVQLLGSNFDEAQTFACAVSDSLNRRLFVMPVERLPMSTIDLEDFAHLWQRDSALFGLALAVEVREAGGQGDSSNTSRLLRLLSSVSTPILITTSERLDLAGSNILCVEVAMPTVKEQFAMWATALPNGLTCKMELAGDLSRQFAMDRGTVTQAIAAVLRRKEGNTNSGFPKLLRRECCERTRPRLEGLAQRIEVKATWSDLVLSPEAELLLKQVRSQVQSRWRVYDEWGMADRMNRGLGISTLFAGESGTGKTMAAEVLANDLNLDLYRVDLSSVVNKYIGETEKHLRRLFDAFDSCGAILFFDECDALFGKRSEVKDSHDRYANIEINYLLQRLESYRGLAILATNNRGALDAAFLRRLRFVVTFAMPSTDERLRIWQRLLPAESDKTQAKRIPVSSLDNERLAQFQFSGGSIQNVVLNAAFRAASRSDRNVVTMQDVLAAAKDEYLKLERPINDSDFHYRESKPEEAAA